MSYLKGIKIVVTNYYGYIFKNRKFFKKVKYGGEDMCYGGENYIPNSKILYKKNIIKYYYYGVYNKSR